MYLFGLQKNMLEFICEHIALNMSIVIFDVFPRVSVIANGFYNTPLLWRTIAPLCRIEELFYSIIRIALILRNANNNAFVRFF